MFQILSALNNSDDGSIPNKIVVMFYVKSRSDYRILVYCKKSDIGKSWWFPTYDINTHISDILLKHNFDKNCYNEFSTFVKDNNKFHCGFLVDQTINLKYSDNEIYYLGIMLESNVRKGIVTGYSVNTDIYCHKFDSHYRRILRRILL